MAPPIERPQEFGNRQTSGPRATGSRRAGVPRVSDPEALRPQARPVDTFEGVAPIDGKHEALRQLSNALTANVDAATPFLQQAARDKKARDRKKGEELGLDIAAEGFKNHKEAMEKAKNDPRAQSRLIGQNPFVLQGVRETLGRSAIDEASRSVKAALEEAGLNFVQDPESVREFVADHFKEARDAGGGNSDFNRGFHEQLGPAMAKVLNDQREESELVIAQQEEDAFTSGIQSQLAAANEGVSPDDVTSGVVEKVQDRISISGLQPTRVKKEAIASIQAWALKEVSGEDGDSFTLADLNNLGTTINTIAGNNADLQTQGSRIRDEIRNRITSRQAARASARKSSAEAAIDAMEQAATQAFLGGDVVTAEKELTRLALQPGGAAKAAKLRTSLASIQSNASVFNPVSTARVNIAIDRGDLNGPNDLLLFYKEQGIPASGKQFNKDLEKINTNKTKRQVYSNPIYKKAEKQLLSLMNRAGGQFDAFGLSNLQDGLDEDEFNNQRFLNGILESFRQDALGFADTASGSELIQQDEVAFAQLLQRRLATSEQLVSERMISRGGRDAPGASEFDATLAYDKRFLESMEREAQAVLSGQPTEEPEGQEDEPTGVFGPEHIPDLEGLAQATLNIRDHRVIEEGRPDSLPTTAFTSPNTTHVLVGNVDPLDRAVGSISKAKDMSPGLLRALVRADEKISAPINEGISDAGEALSKGLSVAGDNLSKGLATGVSNASDALAEKGDQFEAERLADAEGREALANKIFGLDPVDE